MTYYQVILYTDKQGRVDNLSFAFNGSEQGAVAHALEQTPDGHLLGSFQPAIVLPTYVH